MFNMEMDEFGFRALLEQFETIEPFDLDKEFASLFESLDSGVSSKITIPVETDYSRSQRKTMKSDIASSEVDLEQQKPDDNNNDSENSSYDDKSADDVLSNVATMGEDKTDKDYFSSPSPSSACPTSSLANDFDDMQDFYGTGTTGSLRSSYSLGSGNGNGICRPTMISGKYRQKEERRKMLKVSMAKLRRIDDPEITLLRSVLINNTVRRLQREAREEKSQKAQSTCSGASGTGNPPSQSKCFGITNDFITKQQEDNLKNPSDELSFLTASTINHRANEQLLAITSLHDNPSANKSARSLSPIAHSSSASPVTSSSSSSGTAAADELTSNGNEDDERIIVQSIARDFDLPSPLELPTTIIPTSNITTDSASLVTSTISSSSSCPASSSAGSLSSSTVSNVQPHHHHHHSHHHHHQRKRSIENNESSLVDDCDVVLNQFYLQACAIPTKMLSALDEDEDEDVNVVDIDTSPPISVDLVDHHSSSVKRRRLMSPSDCCKTAADRLRDNISSSSPLLMPPLVADDWSSSMIDDDTAAVFMQPNLLSSANCMSHGQPALTAATSPHQGGNFSCGHSSLLNEIVVYHNLIASLES